MADDDAMRIDWYWSDFIPSWFGPALVIGAVIVILFCLLIYQFIKSESAD